MQCTSGGNLLPVRRIILFSFVTVEFHAASLSHKTTQRDFLLSQDLIRHHSGKRQKNSTSIGREMVITDMSTEKFNYSLCYICPNL